MPDLGAVREASAAITAAHLFIYLAPEAAEEATAFGVTDRQAVYFAFRSAALGAVPWQVTLATFYNFPPQKVQSMDGVWDAAAPEQWQAARFRAAARAMQRVGVHLTTDEIAHARSLIDPVVDGADYAGKTMAAANASLALPSDPLLALWQQITVLREWRGDAHFLVLAGHHLGASDCNVIDAATGRLPTPLVRATRGFTDEQWSAATARLVARGWLNPDGTVTHAGTTAREQIEIETDKRCAALWAPIGGAGARRFASLIAPINHAFTAAGTYELLRS